MLDAAIVKRVREIECGSVWCLIAGSEIIPPHPVTVIFASSTQAAQAQVQPARQPLWAAAQAGMSDLSGDRIAVDISQCERVGRLHHGVFERLVILFETIRGETFAQCVEAHLSICDESGLECWQGMAYRHG